MQPEIEKVTKVAADSTPAIIIAGKIEIEGHQLVSKKLLEITNHILTESQLFKETFEAAPDCICKIRFLPNFNELGKENDHKFGVFNPETAEIMINLQRHFDSAKEAIKEGNNMELLCIRAHLWFSLLTTLWHEFMHAATYAIDPEGTLNEDKEVLEEIIAEQAMVELTNFTRDVECEPASMADEPFFGTRFMEFFIKEVKDNAEAWALAQNSIYQYNEQNNTHILWKDGDTAYSSFRHWFRDTYEHLWDNEPESLVELKFSLAIPTTTALEAPVATSDGAMLEAVVHLPHEESPFQDENIDPGALDRDALIQKEMLEKSGPTPAEVVDKTNGKWIEKVVTLEDDMNLPPADTEAEATAVLSERGKILTDDDITEVAPDIIEKTEDKSDEAHLSDQYDWTEAVVDDSGEDFDPGDMEDEQAAIQPGLDTFPSPAARTTLPATPPATEATGTPLPEATPEPTFAPGADPAPPAGEVLPATSTQPAAPQPSEGGTYSQTLRTGLPNYNFTGEQMKEMCEQVFIRCANHIFAKCGWTPGGNPPFVPELRGAIMEPISMSGIPGIENFLIGMDIVDPNSGTYVINSPASAHGGMVKGKVTQKQHLPSYTLYFNYNGIEIKRFICPQNQWKLNAQHAYSGPAQRAQQGAQITWIMDGDDHAAKKWRAKIENGIIEWFV